MVFPRGVSKIVRYDGGKCSGVMLRKAVSRDETQVGSDILRRNK